MNKLKTEALLSLDRVMYDDEIELYIVFILEIITLEEPDTFTYTDFMNIIERLCLLSHYDKLSKFEYLLKQHLGSFLVRLTPKFRLSGFVFTSLNAYLGKFISERDLNYLYRINEIN